MCYCSKSLYNHDCYDHYCYVLGALAYYACNLIVFSSPTAKLWRSQQKNKLEYALILKVTSQFMFSSSLVYSVYPMHTIRQHVRHIGMGKSLSQTNIKRGGNCAGVKTTDIYINQCICTVIKFNHLFSLEWTYLIS